MSLLVYVYTVALFSLLDSPQIFGKPEFSIYFVAEPVLIRYMRIQTFRVLCVYDVMFSTAVGP